MERAFAQIVYDYVSKIPTGRVMTYGQLAVLAGHPRAARQVGGIAHFGPEELPWHRVVNKQGGMASAFPGGRDEQARRLEAEGIRLADSQIANMEQVTSWP